MGEQVDTGREQALRLIEQAAAEGWTELDLSEMDLVELPTEIVNLTQLEVLILGRKKQKTPEEQITELVFDFLFSLLPPIIETLRSLQADFSKTQLSEVPESIAQLSNLRVLDLRGTQISELPESITQLSNLQVLNLGSSQISELPESITQLSNLQVLNLDSTQISELPESITQLSNLQVLNLGSTQISELPESITQLRNLQVLYLDSTQISELLESITQLSNLQVLNLGSTQISKLPESITQLSNLQALNLDSIQISELPESITQLSNLQVLNLDSIQISELPESITQLSNLQVLNLDSTQISKLPESITQLSNLQVLNLDSTQISELPGSITQLSNLQVLDLSSTQISELPGSITQLSNLQVLDLSSTQISELPESITQLSNLQVLYLGSTQISELPESITQLSNLQVLNLGSTQISKLPESITQLSNLQALNLDSTQISELPESITQLTSLQSLNLSGTKISELPESITQLTSLQSLDLSGTKISELPESITQLTSLQSLDLSGTKISELPESVTQLSSLQSLNLSGTKISELPESIIQLTSLLQSLYLSGTKISELPESVTQLSSLQSLNLNSTQISELPESVTQLSSLQSFNLSGTKISELPDSVTQLSSLQSLNLMQTQISVFPEIVTQLPSLQELDLDGTAISKLSDSISQLTNLTSLDIRNTQISELPQSITQLSGLQSLYLMSCRISQLPNWWKTWSTPASIGLSGNPLPIPEALLSSTDPDSLQAIINFYFQTQDPEAKPLYEAKLLIVGEGETGKTTLAKKLQDRDYKLKLIDSDNPEKSTEGIDIIQWQFDQADGTPFRVNVWDFGGQEVYHATHQFFLTKRSLYALVVDNRRENPNFYYWLNVVRLLSDNSPVFIVKNEKQNRQCEINEGQLRAEFKSLINQTICVNFAENRGLDELETMIKTQMVQLPEVQQPWPPRWVRIRNVLENYDRNYIDLAEYLTLCNTNGVPDKIEALQISAQLHELGICLHFQKEPGLKQYVILKPAWVTNAVYQVTDYPKVKNDMGRFSQDDLEDIWSDSEYAELREELLSLMQMRKFSICYPLKDRPDTYIVPSLLSHQRPTYEWDYQQNLILRYEYGFMPKGIIPRLVVEMHRYIEDSPRPESPEEQAEKIGLVWKTGVILRDGDARAQVVETYDRREITIHVSGHQRKQLLYYIRYELRQIHDTYPNLDYQEFIPCNCEQCDGSEHPYTYRLSDLERRLTNQRYEVECEKSYDMVSVQRLISDVIIEPELQRDHWGLENDAGFSDINISINQSSDDHRDLSKTFNQTNSGGTNFQNNISGGKVNQAKAINLNPNASADAHTPNADARTILFLASNPKQTGRLRLDQELRELDESLRRAQRRSQFKLENKGAIRTRDFTRALLDINPHIVHFSGHGKDSTASNDSRPPESEHQPLQGLLFEDETGNPQLVSGEQLADVFELFADQVECVLINACHSHNQADAIAQHIPYVIGMNRPISDKGAIEFAIAFYDAIGAGRDIPFAFKLARTQLTHRGEKDIPQLWSNSSSAS